MATLKQRKLVAKVIENNGNVSKSMREVGYAKSTTTNPQLITKSKTFQELLEKALPDSLLLKKHREGLEATKYEVLGSSGEEGLWEKSEVPDYSTRHKYLQTGYNLKGRANPEGVTNNNNLVILITGQTGGRYGSETTNIS